jgi:hypothetical protein
MEAAILPVDAIAGAAVKGDSDGTRRPTNEKSGRSHSLAVAAKYRGATRFYRWDRKSPDVAAMTDPYRAKLSDASGPDSDPDASQRANDGQTPVG